ncbi:Endomembrane protein 70-domain-containing protein [Jimgerdemannia flammicorona]|uniref:Transmembrane 9 superfamily member n=1 Tax=Jimgerdemannia flammicorona TaxID=994334 RepID=A0A433Q610_9FUNG|nr:Endomembrane protein 70-domain-containing protein [Jimgerdemannia flammicorona]
MRCTNGLRFRVLTCVSPCTPQIHWFSIFNSFMMVLFLTGLVSVILLRTLRRDYARYDKEEGLGDLVRSSYLFCPILPKTHMLTPSLYLPHQDHDLGDDYGWKQVHGDVFRPPQQLMLFSALLGTGNQLAILSGVVILYTIVGDLYAERATILTATIFLYALTSGVAGYTSASYYAKQGLDPEHDPDGQLVARYADPRYRVHQHRCHLLLELQGYCVHDHARHAGYLALPLFPSHPPRRHCRPQLERPTRLPHSRQPHPEAYPREGLVCRAPCRDRSRRDPSLRFHLHRDVLHLHLLLGVQDLLRLRVHATGLRDPASRLCVRHRCEHVLLVECRGSPMALDELPHMWLDVRLRVPVLGVLLRATNKVSFGDGVGGIVGLG